LYYLQCIIYLEYEINTYKRTYLQYRIQGSSQLAGFELIKHMYHNCLAGVV